MIIDFHTHIFPPEIRRAREIYFPAESAFKLLYDSEKAELAGAADIVETMDAQGVDLSVVFGFPWKNPDTCRRHNDYIIEAVARFPGRLKGFCCVDPLHPSAPDEVARCLDAGLSGVGELAFYEMGFPDHCLKCLDPIMAICAERNVPALIHTNEPVGHAYPGKAPLGLADIYGLASRFPKNRVVLAHWGGGIFFYNLLKKAVREALANVWFDTAASPYLYAPEIYAAALRLAGPDRILFGSDFPLIRPMRYFREVAAAGLSEEEISAILGGNARKVLGV